MDNRAKILECALQQFAARGYDAVGVQEIVETAGLTKPTLYHFFNSKEGVLQALLAQHCDAEHARMCQAAAYDGDLTLTLTRIVATQFALVREQPQFCRLKLSLWFAPVDGVPHKAVAQYNERQFSLIEDMFQRAVQQHGNMRGRHSAYAATFLGMVNTWAGLALNGYVELDATVLHRAVHQFMHGILS
jgi:TetR/AcrR family transcriptional regulator